MNAALVVLACLQASAAAAPMEPVGAILDAFRAHAVVALGNSAHHSGEGQALLLSLIRDPRFPTVVNDIVVEFGSARYQEVIDAFIRGEDVAPDLVAQAWRNSTQVNADQRDCPACEALLAAVRAINRPLPAERRLRVLLGDPPIDWEAVRTAGDHRRWLELRDTFPAELIQREVLAKQRKALVLYGGLHLQRKNIFANYESDGLAGTLVSELERVTGQRVFTVWSTSKGSELQPDVATWRTPSLARLRGTPLGAADFTFYYPFDRPRVAMRDGKPDFSATIPREQWRSRRMEDQFDALLFVAPDSDAPSRLSPSMCTDTGYMAILRARMALVRLKPEIDRLEAFCAGVAPKK